MRTCLDGEMSVPSTVMSDGELTREHANLVVDGTIRPHEGTQLPRDRTLAPPLNDRVEDELVAA